MKEWETGRYPERPPSLKQRHGSSCHRRALSSICATAQQFPSLIKAIFTLNYFCAPGQSLQTLRSNTEKSFMVQASQSHELSRLQSLLQIQSRAAALMLVKEDPGILELSPSFIMQRLVDLKVHKLSAPLIGTEHTVTMCF